jgi:diacylglycerol kinase (ATP)
MSVLRLQNAFMKSANLLHNPKAGGGEYSIKKLMALIRSAGFNCSYSSTKKRGWEKIEAADGNFIVLAGGDGTIRKVAGELLDKSVPIGVLPLGTANNIAKTLGLHPDDMSIEDIIEAWSDKQIKKFDVGRLQGLKKHKFFLEGIGYGVFPRLMKEMHQYEKKSNPEKQMKTALEVLHDIILKSKARYCKIEIDGADHSGNFLLAEVMNTQAIGPNLNLAPFADPGDGELEVVLISERQRQDFADYVLNKINGKEAPPIFNILKAKNLKIFWEGHLMHVDDRIVKLKEPTEITIKLQEGVLRFLVPDKAYMKAASLAS